jgi:hypothetical protein
MGMDVMKESVDGYSAQEACCITLIEWMDVKDLSRFIGLGNDIGGVSISEI